MVQVLIMYLLNYINEQVLLQVIIIPLLEYLKPTTVTVVQTNIKLILQQEVKWIDVSIQLILTQFYIGVEQ